MLSRTDEWLATNSFGGYASTTLSGVNTSCYHGLLNSASITGGDRIQLLNSLEEYVQLNGEAYALSTHRYKDTFYPDGVSRLQSYGWKANSLWWVFLLGSAYFVKELDFSWDTESVVLTYRSAEPFTLNVRPLLSFRSHHATRKWGEGVFMVEAQRGSAVFKADTIKPTLRISSESGVFNESGVWYYNFFYEDSFSRGVNSSEDLFSPGEYVLQGNTVKLVAETQPVIKSELKRSSKVGPLSAFIVEREGSPVLVAGYHWFWDWCRDSMIVLPTLVEQTQSLETAEMILNRYFVGAEGGFLPNGFSEWDNKPYYSSVDASLWAGYAIGRIYESTGSKSFLNKHYSKLVSVYEGYLSGAKLGVKFNQHLLKHESPGATWMDASFEGVYYTPRSGYAVEVNSLWLYLLRLLSTAESSQIDRAELQEEMVHFRDEFIKRFTAPFGLFDLLNEDFQPSDEIRPNMLFASSLHPGLLESSQAKLILSTTRRYLLTPYGLRTLSPTHKNYHSVYQGDRAARDAAYHNGTVWPWLLGAYVDSCINYEPSGLPYFERLIQPLVQLGRKTGGLIPEIFDAEHPYTPRGCFAQAWSTSELVRVMAKLASLSGKV
jgi:glycogen debranching enzyme